MEKKKWKATRRNGRSEVGIGNPEVKDKNMKQIKQENRIRWLIGTNILR